MATDNASQRSALKDFLASLATIKGDLSNITAPPFVLADKSTTELPRYWIQYPQLFCAPAAESSPERRILAVLKWFLASLKGQQYAGREPDQGVKKPLNAFLGEIFTGSCGPEGDETRLVSEQVSHHPPVTACYLWNDHAGVRAEGYTRQQITFSGSVNIRQTGHAVLHLDKFNEDYLIPLPNVKVKGILTGGTYPELTEPCMIVSSSGYVAEVDFSGKGFFGGRRNHVEAAIYHTGHHNKKEHIFTVEGIWTDSLTFKDADGNEIDSFDVNTAKPTPFQSSSLDQQDPWESRKAWGGVIESIGRGDMQGVADSKQKLENAQRALRKHPETGEEKWQPLFFRSSESDPTAQKLLDVAGGALDASETRGVWKFNADRWNNTKKPWWGELTPHG